MHSAHLPQQLSPTGGCWTALGLRGSTGDPSRRSPTGCRYPASLLGCSQQRAHGLCLVPAPCQQPRGRPPLSSLPADHMWDAHLPHRDAAGRTPARQEAPFPSAYLESLVHLARPLDQPPESPDPRPALPTAWASAANLGSGPHPAACPGPSAPTFAPRLPPPLTWADAPLTAGPHLPTRGEDAPTLSIHGSWVRARASLGPAAPRTVSCPGGTGCSPRQGAALPPSFELAPRHPWGVLQPGPSTGPPLGQGSSAGMWPGLFLRRAATTLTDLKAPRLPGVPVGCPLSAPTPFSQDDAPAQGSEKLVKMPAGSPDALGSSSHRHLPSSRGRGWEEMHRSGYCSAEQKTKAQPHTGSRQSQSLGRTHWPLAQPGARGTHLAAAEDVRGGDTHVEMPEDGLRLLLGLEGAVHCQAAPSSDLGPELRAEAAFARGGS